MGKFSEASDRTPKKSGSSFRNDDVYVARSKYLKTKDCGLYANRPFKKGDVIQEYKGRKVNNEDALKLEKTKYASKYLFEVSDGRNKVLYVIDGSDPTRTSAARYANTTIDWDDGARNSEFKQYDKKIYLMASKSINKHKEILTFYGHAVKNMIK